VGRVERVVQSWSWRELGEGPVVLVVVVVV
jgi:hypothetical protein